MSTTSIPTQHAGPGDGDAVAYRGPQPFGVPEDLVIPHVLGDAVGLSPLLVIVSVAASALLFGELAVVLAIPLAAVLGTLFEVVVLERDPAELEVPTVLFPAQDAETR